MTPFLAPRVALSRLTHLYAGAAVDVLGIPTDPRGIVLGCGFAGTFAVGLVALLDGDPLGWAYLAASLTGYVFLQTRLMPCFLWLLVAAGGCWGAASGAPGGWVEAGFGLVLAAVALVRPFDSSVVSEEPQPNLIRGSNPAEESAPPVDIAIYSIGHFQVVVDGEDITARLLEKSSLAGLWCYLLTLAARTPEASINRSMLATHLAPGHGLRQQRDKLRRQIWDLQHDLGPALGRLVVADRWSVRLDLSSATFDVQLIRELCAELESTTRGPITAELVKRVQRALDETVDQQFLPDFERLAASAGIDQVIARRLVTEARSHIGYLRGRLAQLLAVETVPSTNIRRRSSSPAKENSK